MGNPQKGEIEFEIAGKRYTWLLGSYGLAKIEERLGKSWPKVMADLDPQSMRYWLAAFHCGLLLHHDDISEREASILLDDLTLGKFIEIFNATFAKQFPAPTAETDANPTAAAAMTGNGIGTPSSASG
jgi:hypothetical protein